MNLWELRQAIESAIPAWVSVAAIIFAFVVLIYGLLTRGGAKCATCGGRPPLRMHGSGHADFCPEGRPTYPEGDDD
jgi:hypothetical protein